MTIDAADVVRRLRAAGEDETAALVETLVRDLRGESMRARAAESVLRQANARIAEMEAWQSIETAPKDGTPVRLLVEIEAAREEHIPALLMGGWKRIDDGGKAIGWRPLPEPPAALRSQSEEPQ